MTAEPPSVPHANGPGAAQRRQERAMEASELILEAIDEFQRRHPERDLDCARALLWLVRVTAVGFEDPA